MARPEPFRALLEEAGVVWPARPADHDLFADARDASATQLDAPPPRSLAVLGGDTTLPGLLYASSDHGQVVSHSDLYRLRLELTDTPARPLPALASLSIVSAGVGDEELAGVCSTDLNRLDELEGIEDLETMARAMGLTGLAVSIPDGLPVDDEPSLPPLSPSVVRRARVSAALGNGSESIFLPDSTEDLPARPSLPARTNTPVIVRIPAHKLVSEEARARGRKLYLSAIDELTRGDRVGAVGHLELAIQYDKDVRLYQDLLQQVAKTGSDEAERTDPGSKRRRSRRDATSASS